VNYHRLPSVIHEVNNASCHKYPLLLIQPITIHNVVNAKIKVSSIFPREVDNTKAVKGFIAPFDGKNFSQVMLVRHVLQ